MNITFILGNGFDRNLNLSTDYQSFYSYYASLPSTGEYAESIGRLKKELDNFLKLEVKSGDDDVQKIDWSDLEIGLGKYAKEFQSEAEFEAVYYDLRDSLKDYLKTQENIASLIGAIDKGSFLDDLTKPEQYLQPVEQSQLLTIKQSWGNNQYDIRVLTFNYTRTFEYLIGEDTDYDLINGCKVRVHEVKHVHRLIDQLILGVNDIGQIQNSRLSGLQFVLDTFVKPNHCRTYADNHSTQCVEYINKADLIVLYGVSIGDTDRRWWQAIANLFRQKNSARLILFWYEKEYHDYRNEGPRRVRAENVQRDNLMTKMGLSRSEKEVFKSRIYVHLIRKEKRIFNLPHVPEIIDLKIAQEKLLEKI